jgi:hypothetical protein
LVKLAHPDDIVEAGRRIQLVFEQKSGLLRNGARLKHKYGTGFDVDYGKF